MDGLVLHDITKRQLAQFATSPSHALLIVGTDGVGKGTLAQHLAANVLAVRAEKLSQHPCVRHIMPDDKGTISIESIRQLQRFLQLKTVGTGDIRRIVIVEHADSLTTEAQNAYLKLLEEPPADTLMILTAGNVRALLPTIMSRLQTLAAQPPDEAALRTWFQAAGKDSTAITQAYFLSGGLPGLMHALLQDDTAHPLLASVTLAKELLQMPVFERLAAVDPVSKQRANALYLTEALLRIAQVGLSQASDKQDTARITRWHRVRKAALSTKEALEQSANTKLALSNLALSL